MFTIRELLEKNAEQYRDQVAFQVRRDGEGGYREYTFTEVAELAGRLQQELGARQVVKGDRVLLLSENRPEWPISYLAITALGAVVVPLDAMLKPDELAPLIADSGAKTAVVSRQFASYVSAAIQGPIIMEEFDSLPNHEPRNANHVMPDDLAAIVYTSGTTGVPKGVMLSHGNLMSNVTAVASLFDLGPRDNFLSVLPLHHTFETTAGFLGPFRMGCRITYAESLKSHNLLRNMQETGVTVMCGVPLLYQLFRDGIRREVEEKGLTRAFTAMFAVSRFFRRVLGFNIGRLLFKTVHAKFGGKIRFLVSGGAALDPDLARDFDLMGFTILQGYGLTESSPILTCNTLQANRIGSVGRVVPGVELKISGLEPAGEILAFGPNIMKGYYKRKDLTVKVLPNGWLHTGDVGYLDEEGYLFITGRCKDVIVTGSGVNVYPEEIEFRLNKLALVKECCVMGEKALSGPRLGSEEVVALVVPDEEACRKGGLNGADQVRQALAAEIEQLNRQMAEFKRIARFVVRNEELPKTRLKKIKRFELRKELSEQ